MRYLFCLLSSFAFYSTANAQANLTVTAIDAGLREGLVGADVILYQKGMHIHGASTDFNGVARLEALTEGYYYMEVYYGDFQLYEANSLYIGREDKCYSIYFYEEAIRRGSVTIEPVGSQIIPDCSSTYQTVTADQIRALPTKSPTAMAYYTGSPYAEMEADEGDGVRFMIACGTADYYIDGERIDCASLSDEVVTVDTVDYISPDTLPITSPISPTPPTIRIYPNPATDILYLDGGDLPVSARLLDASGRVVRTRTTNATHIDLTGLAPGIYFVELQREKKARVERVVVER